MNTAHHGPPQPIEDVKRRIREALDAPRSIQGNEAIQPWLIDAASTAGVPDKAAAFLLLTGYMAGYLGIPIGVEEAQQ